MSESSPETTGVVAATPEQVASARLDWAAARARTGATRCAMAGVVAWAVTVAPVFLASRAPWLARTAAGGSLLVLLALGKTLAERPRLGRALGIFGFTGLSALAWGLVAGGRVLASVDPMRGFLGVAAWAIYAASWSHPWSVPDAQLAAAPQGAAHGLVPRRDPPRTALVVGALGGLAAALCIALSFLITDRDRALFGRALAIVAAVSLTSHAATIATVTTRDERTGSIAERFPIDAQVVRVLFAAAMLVGVGVAIARLR